MSPSSKVILWNVFRGDEGALRSMKESNLIAVNPRNLFDEKRGSQCRVWGGLGVKGAEFRIESLAPRLMCAIGRLRG